MIPDRHSFNDPYRRRWSPQQGGPRWHGDDEPLTPRPRGRKPKSKTQSKSKPMRGSSRRAKPPRKDHPDQDFVDFLKDSPQLEGKVLDIGSGGRLPPPLRGIQPHYRALDGVDPDPEVVNHPLLGQCWNDRLEVSHVPSEAYDLAYANNVLQYVDDPVAFFQKVHDLLKPGGVFWGMTVNGRHPFARLSRLFKRVGLHRPILRWLGKETFVDHELDLNHQATYYRANRPDQILEAVRGLGFREASFYYLPSSDWWEFFPRWLRWLPALYDLAVGTRKTSWMQTFIVRLEKA